MDSLNPTECCDEENFREGREKAKHQIGFTNPLGLLLSSAPEGTFPDGSVLHCK